MTALDVPFEVMVHWGPITYTKGNSSVQANKETLDSCLLASCKESYPISNSRAFLLMSTAQRLGDIVQMSSLHNFKGNEAPLQCQLFVEALNYRLPLFELWHSGDPKKVVCLLKSWRSAYLCCHCATAFVPVLAVSYSELC